MGGVPVGEPPHPGTSPDHSQPAWSAVACRHAHRDGRLSVPAGGSIRLVSRLTVVVEPLDEVDQVSQVLLQRGDPPIQRRRPGARSSGAAADGAGAFGVHGGQVVA